MDQTVIERYRKERSEYPWSRAAQCLAVAKGGLRVEAELATLPDPPEYGKSITLARDGFTVQLSYEYDTDRSPDSDMECDGWFYRPARGEDANRRPHTIRDTRRVWGKKKDEWITPEVLYRYQSRRNGDVCWWVPPGPVSDFGSAHGASKQVRREDSLRILRSIFENFCGYYEDRWSYVVITVKVMKNGIVLGRSSLGGVENHWKTFDEEFWYAIREHGLIEEAIAEAKKALTDLCECAK